MAQNIFNSLRKNWLLLPGYAAGAIYEGVRFIPNGIDKAAVRSFEGGLEGAAIASLFTVGKYGIDKISGALMSGGNAYKRFTKATFDLIPVGAYAGAVVNSFQQYFDKTPDASLFLERAMKGGLVGGVVVFTPWLLCEGQRHGVYSKIGKIAKGAGTGIYNLGYSFGHNRGWW